jgi:hypothetical protein
MTLDSARSSQRSFTGFCSIEAALASMATAGVEWPGAVSVNSGDYAELSELTCLKTFITSFAGHIAAEAARSTS